jgi:hypothetical protein
MREENAPDFFGMRRWMDGVSLKMDEEWELEGEVERRFCCQPRPEEKRQMPWR